MSFHKKETEKIELVARPVQTLHGQSGQTVVVENLDGFVKEEVLRGKPTLPGNPLLPIGHVVLGDSVRIGEVTKPLHFAGYPLHLISLVGQNSFGAHCKIFDNLFSEKDTDKYCS